MSLKKQHQNAEKYTFLSLQYYSILYLYERKKLHFHEEI